MTSMSVCGNGVSGAAFSVGPTVATVGGVGEVMLSSLCCRDESIDWLFVERESVGTLLHIDWSARGREAQCNIRRNQKRSLGRVAKIQTITPGLKADREKGE